MSYQVPGTGTVTSSFGKRRAPVPGASTYHKGVDISMPIGSKVTAAASGVVTQVKREAGYGNWVEIRHNDGTFSRYAHLNTSNVSVGQSVSAGQSIAVSGNTGRSSGPHLHFELRDRNGNPIDPAEKIPGLNKGSQVSNYDLAGREGYSSEGKPVETGEDATAQATTGSGSQSGCAGLADAYNPAQASSGGFGGGGSGGFGGSPSDPAAFAPDGGVTMGGAYASPAVVAAMREGSSVSGIPLGYMFAKAQQESAFNPNAKAGTSSARGLYQFIDGTWSEMVTKYGTQYGIGMGDRYNPRASAIMGGLYAKENKSYLEMNGHTVGNTELYMGHFLGPEGANKYLNALKRDPNAPAYTAVSPAQANANRSIFFDKEGRPRSLLQVYQMMQGKIDNKATAYQELLDRDKKAVEEYKPYQYKDPMSGRFGQV